MSIGGTQMYCPSCNAIQVCTAIPITELGRGSNQRRYYSKAHRDVTWFERARRCQQCSHAFTTAELDLGFVRELIAFRDAANKLGAEHQKYLASEDFGSLHRAIWDIAYETGNTEPFKKPPPPLRSV